MASLYIHIPFCESRCAYCAFYSSTYRGNKADYLSALCRELELRRNYLSGAPIRTLYFGGGTPSLLSVEEFSLLMESLRRYYDLSSLEEFTVEVNPDDVTHDFVAGIAALGVNRISMGVQSFHDEDLRLMGRRHSVAQVYSAVEAIRGAGIENVSIDLIYGLPGQTKEAWRENLAKAVALDVQHLSAYSLTYEEGSKLSRLAKRGKVHPVGEEDCADMFALLRAELAQAGFYQYEISNFAKPGMESKHNSSYWDGTPYLGVGASAHSYDGTSRQWNIANTRLYIAKLQQGADDYYEVEQLDLETRYNDFVLTSLRTRKGMDLALLEEGYTRRLYDYCLKNASKYISEGLLIREDGFLRLSESGLFVSDGVMSDLMWVE
ncbi:MAG: radical SAM family heme chaperone HemW [Paludibacteraceae bacterium]|nr:radical SAM family heme chaperone HemW [Paludibacteraceae bacterium]